MEEEQRLSYYINKASELNNLHFDKKIRIAILSSFTLNGLAETIRVKCAKKKIQCNAYVGSYDQYNQEILDSQSDLYKFNAEVLFLFIDTRSLLKDLFYNPYSISDEQRKKLVNEKVSELLNLYEKFTQTTKSKFVLANFAIPSFSPYGIFENKTEFGFHRMIDEINNRITNALSNSDLAYIYDFSSFARKYGEQNIFDYKQFFFGDIKISLDFIPYLASDLISYIIGHLGISKKCIVLDLDNTLWGGIVGEDGFGGIKLGPEPAGRPYMEFQRTLLALQQRGIILAVNSKNNYDDAIKIIREHPYMILREDHLTSLKINWNDKASNMREIANELNIGLDSMVFFDDDPVNREYIQNSFPEILTVNLPKDPSEYVEILQNMKDFNVLNITQEDHQRGKMYLEQKKRSDLEKSALDLPSFLKQLNLRISIKPANEFTIPRISQLTLKTNQFNLTTKRYQENDIRKFSQSEDYLVGCARVEDKYGDNGITGVFIVKKDSDAAWIIDSFLLSCRVMGREIEKGLLDFIIRKAKDAGIRQIKAQYIPTAKNKPIEDFLPNCGFKKQGEYWVYDTDSPFPSLSFLTISVE